MNWTIPVIFLVFILIFICVKTFSSGSNVNSSKNIIPGPRPLPIIGNLHIVNLQKLQQSLEEMSKKYGTIFSIHLGSKRMVVLSGYETVKDALVNHADEFAERPEVPIFRYIHNGFGVAFSHGDNWKMMRRFTLSTLRDFGMGRKTLEEKVAEESTFLIKDFESHKGNHFNFTVTLHLAIANIITSIVFGQRFEYDNPQLCRLSSLVKEIFRLLGNPMVLLYNVLPAIRFLPGDHKTVMKYVDEMQSFLRKTYLEHLQKLDIDIDNQRSFTDVFLVRQHKEKEDPNSYFHDGNLLSLLSALFMAGTDTISGTLRWGLLLMAVYPEIQSKVQEEIERVIEKAQPRTEHRKQMPYTDAVIHEIQRIANIVPLNLPRETTVDVTFKGYFIPKGTYIIPLLESVLRDETQFEKPNEFNPQRFLDTEGKFVKREAFMPFSAGRRICIGETLAKMELFIFFTSLIQKFTFFPPPGVTHVHIAPDTGFTAPPQYQRICAVPRF
ncbi:cytochrome P450 2K6-like isoform X1 [Rhinatrema bivittatum]|uniref:cytochrome P450 2K6-like isoform X1 n=1 Tax=Rhinatrema bivittatum TaxID=194408 RepID=UPI00112703E5|nr:cytochrome P450 2K6-like isoform X1 [Rhinatrema bivittatum]